MQYSGILFMVAAVMLACAFNISQIFIGRVFQGIAVSPSWLLQTCLVISWLAALHLLLAELLCALFSGYVVLAATQAVPLLVLVLTWVGVQISFASVSVPIYNSEMAPPQHRGRLNQLYQPPLTGEQPPGTGAQNPCSAVPCARKPKH